MECKETTQEIVESARLRMMLTPPMRGHLRQCESCRERWEAEESLTAPIRRIRAVVAGERSPESRKRELLAEFDRIHKRPRMALPWVWSAAAAVSFAAMLLVLRNPAPRTREVPVVAAEGEFVGARFVEITEANGFMPVPYTPPLAPGESVRIVRRELDGAELARMGFKLPAVYGEGFDADVVLGEDGLPRAVHLVNESEL